MKPCPNCGSLLTPGASDCERCGALLAGESFSLPPSAAGGKLPLDSAITDPTTTYASGMVFSFSSSLLIGYPVAAVFKPLGIAPDIFHWLLLAIVFTCVTYGFTVLRKPLFLQQFNFMILAALFVLVLGVAHGMNPNVGENTFQLMILSVFTLGAPLAVPVVSFFYHANACLRLAT